MTSLYLPGGSKIGVGYQVHAMANQMTMRGHEVTVYSQCEAGVGAEYRLERVPPGRRFRTFGFAWDLRDVDFTGYDVLHAHGDDWFLWGKKRPRHIHTYHGSCFAEFIHEKKIREKARMLGLAVCESGSVRLCDEPVGVSENTKLYLPGIRHVIPNGVDLSRFTPGDHKERNPVVLFVGALRGRKRGELLVREFQNNVRKEVPETELWVVCDEPVSGPNVRWFGRVPDEVLRELYRRAWVFCLPSSYEGFGIPYVEAMASGTAVVSTPNRGAVEVLRKGTCGLIVSDDRLAKGLVQVIRDAALRKFLENAGLSASHEYGWPRVCEAYEALYHGRVRHAGRELVR